MKNKIINLHTGIVLMHLTHGKSALIDELDIDLISGHKWIATCINGAWYATCGENYKQILLHRFIMLEPAGSEIDHVDGNGLNNTRANLRICSHSLNMKNRKIPKNNKTGYKGVSFTKRCYRAYIEVDGKKISLGCFSNSKSAAIAYNNAASKYFGEFARLNDI
jgi:hypothetical protein